MLSYLLLTGAANGCIYGLVALSIVILVKGTGSVNFAQGEFVMLAGFVTFTLHVLWKVPYVPAMLAAIACVVLVAVVMYPLLRPLFDRNRSASFLVATLGLSLIFKGAARQLWGGQGDVKTIPPLIDATFIFLDDIVVRAQDLVLIGGALLVMGVFALFFSKTRTGRFLQAAADNPQAARLVGIRLDRVNLVALSVSVVVCATAGVLVAPVTLLYVDMGFGLFVKGFAAAVVGGLLSLPGAIVGGLAIGIIETLVGGYISTSIQEITAFIVIFIVLLFMPAGLFGARAMRRV
ncbi:MAG: branched-chain amino acid ABC transporter permease [Burkholderiaceae bacterium]|nr:branched-chain amino acid ABC transporter permease [Burkholderiaceae bacterium]MDO9089601.1 branched-chain amino acid ABC transporter permease [Burkholderiaceae bacterium]